jgi:cytochrome P450/NADPH-cytochrome P450 reductase
LHGSNLGTCAGIARELADGGSGLGFTASVEPLDDAVGKLSADGGVVVIVAASYNGRPTDDAAAFVDWLEHLTPGSLRGVRYAVLGVGDRNWAATYQRIPTLVDERLTAAGAASVVARGAADAAADLTGAVDRWTEGLWDALIEPRAGDTTGPETAAAEHQSLYEVVDAADSAAGQLAGHHGLRPMQVLEARELVDVAHPLGRSKRFLKLRLPDGVEPLGHRRDHDVVALCAQQVERRPRSHRNRHDHLRRPGGPHRT